MSLTDLLPVPVGESLTHEGDDALKALVEDYNSFKAISKQNTDRLGQVSLPPAAVYRPSVGGAVAYSDLDSLPFILGTASLKQGLVVAPGVDTNKVNVTFTYLGVGPYILGSGASVTYTADITSAGAGGLDTGAVAASTWYAVHAIAGPAAGEVKTTGNILQPPARRQAVKTNVLLSLSAAAPTMPIGFNRFRRVGWVKTTSGSAITAFINTGDWWHWDAPLDAAPFRVLNAGTQTSFTDVACTGVVPSTSKLALLHLQADNSTGGTAGTGFFVRPNGSARTNDAGSDWAIGGGIPNGSTIQWGEVMMPTDASQVVEYKINSAGFQAYIYVTGYYDVP